MFSTVKGRNKALRNKVTKEAELYELNFEKKLNDYLFDEKLEDNNENSYLFICRYWN